MPTALELLSTEACDDILVVDLESRTIVIPENVSVLGVESDDETRILHFHIPRHYCEIDLSEFLIRINYKNAKDEGDLYIVTDAVIEDDLIKFDWVVGRHAFTKKGNVVFNVCLKDVFEGIVRREFNTTPTILPVLEGLETGNAIVEEHLDIFEQMREELTANIGDDIGEAIDTYFAEHADELRGEPFKYEDFTAEQLEALRGPKGDTFTYDDLTEEQIQSLKGPRGDAFKYEDFTPEQLESLKGDAFKYEDFTAEQLEALRGPKGDTFAYDDLTEEQIQSLKGPKGDTFTYDDLTEEQIQSLKGPQGDPFEYEDFTEEQLAKLAGPAGSSIKSIARTSGNGAPGTTDTYTVTLTDGSTTTFQVYNGANGEGAGDMTSVVYDPTGKKQDVFKYVDDAVSNIELPDDIGDMQATVYDPQGKAQDIFKYVDDAVANVDLPDDIGDMQATVYDPQGKAQDIFKYVDDAVANIELPDDIGDMQASVYDPQGKAQDIFKYVDDAVGNLDIPDLTNVETVNAWGTISASSDETSMTMHANGIGDGNGNVWIDQAGDAWFKEVHVGSGEDYKEVVTTNADGELIMNGNIKGHYVTGEWLRTVAEDTHLTEAAEKIAVIDESGWVYHRTPAEILSDIGAAAEDHTHDNAGGATAVSATLTTSGWAQGADGRYAQTVSVAGVTTDESQVIVVDVHLTGTDTAADNEALAAWGPDNGSGPSSNNIKQGNGTLTFYCTAVPSVNIPLIVGVH